jgi:hypothetical protein
LISIRKDQKYVFFYILFNDASSNSDSVQSYEIITVNNELGRMWKKAAVPGMRYSPGRRTEKNYEKSRSANWFPGLDFNPKPPNREQEGLHMTATFSIKIYK